MAITSAEPYRFFQYGLGLVAPKDEVIQELVHIAKIYLPFVTLIPLAKYLPYAVTGWNVLCSAASSQLLTWQGARNVLEFACTYFRFRATTLLHHALNVGENSYTLADDVRQSKWKNVIEKSLHVMGDLLYLATFMRPRSMKIPVIALYFQTVSYFIRAAIEAYYAYRIDPVARQLQVLIDQDTQIIADAEDIIESIEKLSVRKQKNENRLNEQLALRSEAGQRRAARQNLLRSSRIERISRRHAIGCNLVIGCIRLLEASLARNPIPSLSRDKPYALMRVPGGKRFVVMDEFPYADDKVKEKIQALKTQEGATSVQFACAQTFYGTVLLVVGKKFKDSRLQDNDNYSLLRKLKETDRTAYRQSRRFIRQEGFDAKVQIAGFESGRENFNRVDAAIRETLDKTDQKTLTVFIISETSLSNWREGLRRSLKAV